MAPAARPATARPRIAAEVIFTRDDGAELAFVRGMVLERPNRDARWERVAVLEGSPMFRRRRLLALADARGYLTCEPPAPPPPPPPPDPEEAGALGTVIRGQFTAPGYRRTAVIGETPAGDHRWRARLEHTDAPWQYRDDLGELLVRVLDSPTGQGDAVDAHAKGVAALAARMAAKAPE